tara:strand:- start:331 stop:1020 length:690 start_codon:yes stop_codon:yes gene_type:complete
MSTFLRDNPKPVRDLIEKHSIFSSWMFASYTFFPNKPFYLSKDDRKNKTDGILLCREGRERWPYLTSLRMKQFFQNTAVKTKNHLHVALAAGEYLDNPEVGSTYHYHYIIGVQRCDHSEKVRVHLRDKFAGSSKVYHYDSNTVSYPNLFLDVPSTYEANAIYYILGHHEQTLSSTLNLHGTYCGLSRRCRRINRCSFHSAQQVWEAPPEHLKKTIVYRLSQNSGYYNNL